MLENIREKDSSEVWLKEEVSDEAKWYRTSGITDTSQLGKRLGTAQRPSQAFRPPHQRARSLLLLVWFFRRGSGGPWRDHRPRLRLRRQLNSRLGIWV